MRTRSPDYYLERIGYQPAALYADGSVGELERTEVERVAYQPSRVEGRRHPVKNREQGLAQVALHESLADYIANRKQPDRREAYFGENKTWTLEDIPPEVVAEYERWQRSFDPKEVDKIRESAEGLTARSEDLDALVQCRHCRGESRYACWMCGYSRQFYAYPLVRFNAGSDFVEAPLDVARVVSLNPEAVTIENRYRIVDSLLHGERVLTFHTDRVPASYLGSEEGSILEVDSSDELHKPVEIIIDRWSEDRARQLEYHYEYWVAKLDSIEAPQDYVRFIQEYIAQDLAKERPDGEEYTKKYNKLLHLVGKTGLALSFGYRNAGMGDVDARFELVDPTHSFATRSVLTYSVDSRSAINDALQVFERE